jgi:peptidoglycan hydrolase CwlO-like protein
MKKLFIFFLVASFILPNVLFAQTTAERRAELERELDRIEKEIDDQQAVLDVKQRQRVTLERDVDILNAQIKKSQLGIQARNIEIQKLNTEIGSKEATIGDLSEKMKRERASLAQLIRRTNEIDNFSLVEVALSNQALSEFFEDIDSFSVIKEGLQISFEEIRQTKSVTEEQKLSLEDKHVEEVRLKSLLEIEKQNIEAREAEKANILKLTRGQEKAYQEIIKSKQKTASEIRSELFSLRDSPDISFGDAYEYAKLASAGTGVRPAFLLAILTQESNLGKNVGQCFLTNSPQKGDGAGKNTGTLFDGVMKPTRDVDPFLEITGELGIDPFSQVVSCPQGSGYGGAMGPAQFIPSTWMLYRERIAKVSGENPPNPWSPRTAFIASSLLLADNGADRGTYDSEYLAAMRYFAGWANAANPSSWVRSYGSGVMQHAADIQKEIDVLEGN